MTHSFTVPAADASETRANIMENVGIYQLGWICAVPSLDRVLFHSVDRLLCSTKKKQKQKNLHLIFHSPLELSFTSPYFSLHCLCSVGHGLLDDRMVTVKSLIRPVPQLELRFWNRDISLEKQRHYYWVRPHLGSGCSALFTSFPFSRSVMQPVNSTLTILVSSHPALHGFF